MRTVAAVCLVVLVAACTPGGAEQSRPPAAPEVSRRAQRLAPVTTLESQYCQRPRTFVEVGMRSLFVPSRWTAHRRLTVHVGDVIRLRATGNCGGTVSASPQNPRLRVVSLPQDSKSGPRHFEAVRPGVVRLEISMPMCALPLHSTVPRCVGGIRPMGTALVTVRQPAERTSTP